VREIYNSIRHKISDDFEKSIVWEQYMVKVIKVGVLVFHDLEELDLAGMWEVLGATRRLYRRTS
jgi:hypothetical protein